MEADRSPSASATAQSAALQQRGDAMGDLRSWLAAIEQRGLLQRISGADADLEIGILTDVNGRRKGPVLLFDAIPGYHPGCRIVTGALIDAQRLALTLGLPEITTDDALVVRLETLLAEAEQRAQDFPPQPVSDGPVMETRVHGAEVDLTRFPAPHWHERDGGRYLGTGCVVITRDPDTGTVNLGTYRIMLVDQRTVTLHISPAHHGLMAIRKYHERGQRAPVAISFGHHPLFLVAGGLGLPYTVSEYQLIGALSGGPVQTIEGPVTGLPLPSSSELAVEGFCPPGQEATEGPFGEFTGYYASGEGRAPILQVEAVYSRADPINLGAMPGKPPNDYSYMMCVTKAAALAASLKRDGIPDVQGAWYHEMAAGDPFIVVSIKQRYPGHARQAAFMASQCRVGGLSVGRYLVVVDEDIDPEDLGRVVWAIATRSNPERDIDLIRNTYASPVDPMYRGQGWVSFGTRAIIDATRPFDQLATFPPVAESSPEAQQRVLARWQSKLGW